MIINAYHLVQIRLWPCIVRRRAGLVTLGTVYIIHTNYVRAAILGITTITLIIECWWWDVRSEALYLGCHRNPVQKAMAWGILLFISSEVIFFSAFFWTFFHRRLSPTPEIGIMWPPQGVRPLNPYEVPLLNTAILLTSGISVTARHHCLVRNDYKGAIQDIITTISLGVLFTTLQWAEYSIAEFRFRDRIYGSVFFITTGFHGLHVIIGTTFLTVSIMRIKNLCFSTDHHFSFEARAWYWHFVDVIWIFLFRTIYWWSTP